MGLTAQSGSYLMNNKVIIKPQNSFSNIIQGKTQNKELNPGQLGYYYQCSAIELELPQQCSVDVSLLILTKTSLNSHKLVVIHFSEQADN